MKKSKRLQVIQNIAIKKEDEAVIELGKANTQLSMMQSQLNKLYQYRADYSQQFNQAGKEQMNSTSLQDYIQFINNLNSGINRLLESIEQQKKLCEQIKLYWLEKHQKVTIYGKVKAKFLTEEIKQQDKQEQKLNDEAATAFFIRKNR